MKRKLVTLLLALCLMMCMVPMTAFALTDTESNDTLQAAQKVKLGDTINGSISTEKDIDYYKFSISEAGRVTLDTTFYMRYYSLYIYDTSGTKIWYTEHNEWNSAVGFRNDVYTIDLTAGTYYLKVLGAIWEGATSCSTGNYTLKSSFTSANATETEPNNSIATADTMSGSGSLKGQIASNDSHDFHKISLSQSGRLTLDMTSYMRYYSLYLFDTSGTVLWDSEGNEWDSAVGFLRDVYTIDLTSGTYYLKVIGAIWEGATSSRSTGNYKLKSSFTSANATETESNNSIADADLLSQGSSVTGQIAINDNYDFYKVTLRTDCRLHYSVTSYMEYYAYSLYDANGKELINTGKRYRDSSAGYREDHRYTDLTAGTYYFKFSGSGGTYKFTLRQLSAPEVKISNANSAGKIKLTWNKVEDAVKYKIYRSTSENGYYTELTTTTGNSYTDNGITTGKTYYYHIIAVADDGSVSDKSNTVSGTCRGLAQPVVTLGNKTSTGKITISWKPVDGAAKYQVYRATSKNGTYSRLITTTKTSITNNKTTAGKTYYYYVVAVAEDGSVSEKSNIVSRTCDLAQPVVKVGNKASTGKITVKWEPVEGATKYQVYRATSKNGTYTRLITTTSTSITNTKTTAGKTYYYKVRAICDNSAATSAFSSVKSRMCDLEQPDVSITRSSGKPKVSWDKVPGAVSYKVYRATSKNGTYSLVKTTTSRYYKDTKSKSGRTYYYKVIAVCSNTSGNSAYSGVVSIKSK